MTTYNKLQKAAKTFIQLYNELYESWFNYQHGSKKKSDKQSYQKVMEQKQKFMLCYFDYWGLPIEPIGELDIADYELAEAFI